MDKIPNEIIFLIFSYLSEKDAQTLRLVSRRFGANANQHALNSLTFYLHQTDLDMLERLSHVPNVANHVRSLTYIGHTLQTPAKTFPEFKKQYRQLRLTDTIFQGKWLAHMQSATGQLPSLPNLKPEELRALYQRYLSLVESQESILAEGRDCNVLRDVVQRFPAIRDVTMSNDFWFHHHGMRTNTPFKDCLINPGMFLHPIGCRQLDSLLAALIAQGSIRLDSLRVGLFSWRFFDRDATALSRALAPCANLSQLELYIDTGMQEGGTEENRFTTGTQVFECGQVMSRGLLRDFIATLDQLKTLYIVFNYSCGNWNDAPLMPASLHDVIQPRQRWEHLESLTLGNVACERQDLLAFLKRHKRTLEVLELESVRLMHTSWLVLLPQIRRALDLEVAVVHGDLFGVDEVTGEIEWWDIAGPDGEYDELRLRLGEYLTERGSGKCPLNRKNSEVI